MRFRSGWYGNSHGHSMAARGIKLYADKHQILMQPLFYAQKREAQVPFAKIIEDIKSGMSLSQLEAKYPEADKEDLRRRGMKALEFSHGNRTLTMLDSNGVDSSVRMAKDNPRLKQEMLHTLEDGQKASFIPSMKVGLLRERLR